MIGGALRKMAVQRCIRIKEQRAEKLACSMQDDDDDE